MILTPQKKEFQNRLLINSFIIRQYKQKPSKIEVLFFDAPSVTSYTSQSEFMARRAAALDLQASHYYVDRLAAWKILEGGETIQIIILGEKAKDNTIKLLTYLCNYYNIPIENIILGFEDKSFILKLVKSIK